MHQLDLIVQLSREKGEKKNGGNSIDYAEKADGVKSFRSEETVSGGILELE